MSQQTVLRVETNVPGQYSGITQYEFLDLYGNIPIKINKSFAELQDIGKRNSDYSIGFILPGSKKNNRFFESFYNVDTQSLYFDATKRTNIKVLIDDESYFDGYMRLNKVSVLNSKVEYDVTLYSNVGDLFGKIGNNLLKDLDFNENVIGYSGGRTLEIYGGKFNHTFTKYDVSSWVDLNIAQYDYEPLYFYPIVHNGYNYSGDTVTLSGSTPTDLQTRLYTSTIVGSYATYAAAYSAGVKRYRINSPQDGIYDNQLKPALSMRGLIQLMFQTYGYTIKSDFFNTPWFRLLYMYGYFSSETTKFSYAVNSIQTLPLEGVELVGFDNGGIATVVVCKLGTGIPCYSGEDITFTITTEYPYEPIQYSATLVIPAGTTGHTSNLNGDIYVGITSPDVAIGTTLKYLPVAAGTTVPFNDGDEVDFSLVIDPLLKQIDLLSSIAKKFNLVFIPDPDVPNQIIIEPYTYYIGTGDIHDWTDKISFDKGFTVEPALNYVESNLILTDQEDGDYGNRQFKDQNNRIYGINNVYNPTDFKSQEKKIDTIFGPEVIRQWDTVDTAPNGGIKLPLGINYAATSVSANSGGNENVVPQYSGVKTKPKLFYYMGSYGPFIDTYGESLNYIGYVLTNQVYVVDSDGLYPRASFYAPLVSHTMPMGNPDTNKITNDSVCILFNSELPTNIGVDLFNTYTENDSYSLFYQDRVDNLYNPNTRFLTGNFWLKLSDVKNFKSNDLIKINDQYFILNKMDGYNLTDRELTKVELIQTNNSPSTYPDRYFKYKYCKEDNAGAQFKFKTDFTNPSLSGTSYNWSIQYDYYVGVLGGNVSGYTTTIRDYQSGENVYIGYNINEISKEEYDSLNIATRDADTFWTRAINASYDYSFPIYIYTDTVPIKIYFNLFIDCADYFAKAASLGFNTGVGGVPVTPTPTPTPTSTPLPTPTLPVPTPTATPSLYYFWAAMGLDNADATCKSPTFVEDRFATTESAYYPENPLCFAVDVVEINPFYLRSIGIGGTFWLKADYLGIIYVREFVRNGFTNTATPVGDCEVCPPTPTETPTPSPTPPPPIPSCFDGGMNGNVYDIVEFADNSLLSSGDFTTFNTISQQLMTHTSLNGTIVDNDFYASGFILTGVYSASTVFTTFQQSDGKVIVAGFFYNTFGTGPGPYYERPTALNIYRVNTDWTIDETFFEADVEDPNFFHIEGPSDTYTITQTTTGGLLMGGEIKPPYYVVSTGHFTAVNLDSSPNVNILYNVTGIDVTNTSDPNQYTYYGLRTLSVQSPIYKIITQPDGKILMTFTGRLFGPTYYRSPLVPGGTDWNVGYLGIVRTNPDGTYDSTWNIGSQGPTPGGGFQGSDSVVYDIALQIDGKIVAGGEYTSFSGVTANRIARLNSNGSLDTSFTTGTGFNGTVTTLTIDSARRIYVGGSFTTYNGTASKGIIRLLEDGSIDTSFVVGSGFDLPVNKITLTSDYGVMVGGNFTTYKGATANRIIKLDTEGTKVPC
jgi:uncharacterized delta-60 repeat protein